MNITLDGDSSTLTTKVTISNGKNKNVVTLEALAIGHVVSPSNQFLYVQLANSDADDSGKFIKINTGTLERVYSITPEWGWAQDYAFTKDENLLVNTKYGTYEINHDGLLADNKSYYLALIKASDTSSILALPEFISLNGGSEESYKVALESLQRFLDDCQTMYHGKSWAATGLKEKAQILMKMGKDEEALQCCVDALYLNSKAPVKRMINTLSKRLAVDKENLNHSEWAVKLKISVDEEIKNNHQNSELQRSKLQITRSKDGISVIIPKDKPKKKKYRTLIFLLLFIIVFVLLNK